MVLSQNIKQLSKDTLFYGLGNALQSFIAFLLLPIYTRVLSQVDFGIQDLILTSLTIISYLLVLGLDSGSARIYYDCETLEEKKIVLSTWLWTEIIIFVPVTILLIYFADGICRFIFNNASLAPYFQIGVLTIPFSLLNRICSMALRLSFQAKKFSAVIGIGSFTQAVSAILLVVAFGQGVRGVFLSMLVGYFVQSIIAIILVYKDFSFTFSSNLFKSMLSFGLPLVPTSISLWVLNYSNRYFLTRLGTLNDISILAVGTRLAAIVGLFITSVQIAWPPFAYSLIKDPAIAKRTYSRVLTLFVLVSVTIAVTISIFAREAILLLATSKYIDSVKIVSLIMFGTISWGVVGIIGIGFEIPKKSYHYLICTIIGAIVTTMLNFELIPQLGVLGAAIATLAGNLLALIYTYYVAQHYYNVPYEKRKLLIFIIIATVTIMSSIFIDQLFPVWLPISILVKIGVLSLFGLCLLLTKTILISEMSTMLNNLKKGLIFHKV